MGMLTSLVLGLIALPILGVIYIVVKLQRSAKYFKRRQIPYIGARVGRVFKMITGSISLVDLENEIYRDVKASNSEIVGFCDLAGERNLIISDPDLIKNIMVKDFDHFFNRRPILTQHANKYMRKMLFFMESDQWRGVRTKLSPTFTTGRIRRMFQIFRNSSERLELYLKEHMNYPNSTSVDLDFTKVFSKYALSVIANCAFAIDSKSFEVPPNKQSTFETMAKRFGFIFNAKIFMKFLLMTVAPKVADFLGIDAMDHEAQNYCANVVKSVLKQRRETGERGEDFLQLMMDAQQGLLKADEETNQVMMGSEGGSGTLFNDSANQEQGKVTFDDDDIVANGMSFLMAGFDTSQSLMLLTMYTLAIEPEIQEKLYEEIDVVLKRHGGNLSYDAISEMNYLDMIIQESLRLYSPATRTERRCVKQYKIPGSNMVIEKGDIIMIPIRGIHNDPRYYENPDKFIPERFISENKAQRHSYAYLPFGHGPRNCIGMRFALIKVKAVVVQLVKSFRFSPCAQTKIPMVFSNNAVIKPKDNMWLNVCIRKENKSIR